MPSNPHSPRRMPSSSSAEAWHGTPSTSQYAGMMLADPGVPDGRLEREQLLVAELARSDVGRRLVEPALGQPVPDHVLAGGDHAIGEIRALQGLDVGDTEGRGEVRVLAVRLLDPSPARIARDVEDRRERVPGPGHQHPPADRRRHRGDDVGVEARGRPDRLLEARRGPRDQAVQALLMDDRRDPEPRLLDEVVLDLVRRVGDLGRSQVRGSRQARDLPDAVPGQLGQPTVVEADLLDHLECPERPELGELLRRGHPRQEVGHARVDRQ